MRERGGCFFWGVGENRFRASPERALHKPGGRGGGYLGSRDGGAASLRGRDAWRGQAFHVGQTKVRHLAPPGLAHLHAGAAQAAVHDALRVLMHTPHPLREGNPASAQLSSTAHARCSDPSAHRLQRNERSVGGQRHTGMSQCRKARCDVAMMGIALRV